MSNVPPHSGQAPRFERDGARMGGARGAGARAEAEAYPFTLQQLRNHLERLGYQARAQGVGGEVVREMQARVAELRASLAQQTARTSHRADRRSEPGPGAHEAQTRFYERRIQAALADMAAQLREGAYRDAAAQPRPALDVTSRAWLDQRFTAMRDRLEEALAHAAPPPRDDICSALEEARKRLSAMEQKIEHSLSHQTDANARILGVIRASDDADHATASAAEPSLAGLDERLQSLQDSFDRAMNELQTMKSGTQRLAVRASATVARQTARATAQHVAKAVREAAPERRFARLDESVTACMAETRKLNHKTGEIQQTLEDGLDDLRGRINELTLITRKALAPTPAGASAESAAAFGYVAGTATTPGAGAQAQRSPLSGGASGERPPLWQAPARDGAAARATSGGGLFSRIGFALVIVLMVAASFAMLYAQLTDENKRELPAPDSVAPTSTLPDERSRRRPITMENGGPGSVVLPGIILSSGTVML